MASRCKYLSDEPVINDVYKTPENRYLCRNVERNKEHNEFYSSRFVGEPECENCPYREDIEVSD